MAFVRYPETKPWAVAIAEAVRSRKMPPWFADPHFGHFSNDPSLSPTADRHARSLGRERSARGRSADDAPPPRPGRQGWNIPQPDVVVAMPKPVTLAGARRRRIHV